MDEMEDNLTETIPDTGDTSSVKGLNNFNYIKNNIVKKCSRY